MRYLGLALYAEGGADYAFLSPLLLRLCESICATARHAVEIGDVLQLDDAASMKSASRADRIASAASKAAGAWNILFVHSDADSDAVRARTERIDPGLQLLAETGLPNTECVAVVPIRTTDAWMLVDGDALRAAFGTTKNDASLGLNVHGQQIERVTDPKRMLQEVLASSHSGGKRARLDVSRFRNALGERTSLSRLGALPSFAKLEAELTEAMHRLHVLG